MYGLAQENTPNHMLHTVTERYGANKTMKISHDEVDIYAKELWNGLDKFVDTTALEKITIEEHALKKLAALQKACAKHNYPEPQLFGETYESTQKISGFNKQQLKAKVGEESWINMQTTEGTNHIKGGQPVSAQAKTINEICMPYVLHMGAQIVKHAKPGVFIGYGHSKSRFRRLVKRRLVAVKKHRDAKFVKQLSIDIKEQDTTKHAGKAKAMEMLMLEVGTPQVVIDILQTPNINWMFDNPFVKTNVKWRFQSGRSDTLDNNTIDTMMEIGRSFEFTSLKLYLGQGDDANIHATDLKRIPDKFPHFKIDECPIGDFISFLVTPDDIYLDLPRIACKLVSREITPFDGQKMDELKQAMRDLISLHPSTTDRIQNQKIAAAKYGKSVGDMMLLYEYLVRFADPHADSIPSRATKGQAEVVSNILATIKFK
jgi:hypothetical protein